MGNQTRISITRDRKGITVAIKAEKKWFLLIFLPFWLSFWTFGGIAAITVLVTGSDQNLFLIVWLCIWLFGETSAAFIWLWTAFGKEVISIRDGSFIHRREVFGLGLTHTYPIHELFNLRASGFFGSENPFNDSFAQYGLSGGTVAVDTRYGATYRFGINLQERDAGRLAENLEPYFRRDIQQTVAADPPAPQLFDGS